MPKGKRKPKQFTGYAEVGRAVKAQRKRVNALETLAGTLGGINPEENDVEKQVTDSADNKKNNCKKVNCKN
ncbi:hypothetical protein [Methanosarcina sp. WH1]|uniref:hypothetical protein n=1 Tax=Methanosarcina sp. WH1 TaxID=1434102 RepID=UPI00064E4EDC|nr:hypothetical protein [Methanosarcina sp. WH1]